MIVLLVEDDPLVAMTLENALAEAGHTVHGPAFTAKHALEIATREKLTLALVDINLLDGHPGVGLARELLKRWRVPSLLVSGECEEAHANQDAAIGYISKPYAPETVLAGVEVAEHLIEGTPVPEIPAQLEFFRSPA